MPAERALPEWLDRRTAQWCAELCEAMAARLLANQCRHGLRLPAYRGADICANAIRGMLKTDTRLLPPRLSLAPRAGEEKEDG